MLATEHAVPLEPAFFTLATAARTAGPGIIAAPEKLFGASFEFPAKGVGVSFAGLTVCTTAPTILDDGRSGDRSRL
jgi:hypothetical protein